MEISDLWDTKSTAFDFENGSGIWINIYEGVEKHRIPLETVILSLQHSSQNLELAIGLGGGLGYVLKKAGKAFGIIKPHSTSENALEKSAQKVLAFAETPGIDLGMGIGVLMLLGGAVVTPISPPTGAVMMGIGSSLVANGIYEKVKNAKNDQFPLLYDPAYDPKYPARSMPN